MKDIKEGRKGMKSMKDIKEGRNEGREAGYEEKEGKGILQTCRYLACTEGLLASHNDYVWEW
jgi:hypothetical protein